MYLFFKDFIVWKNTPLNWQQQLWFTKQLKWSFSVGFSGRCNEKQPFVCETLNVTSAENGSPETPPASSPCEISAKHFRNKVCHTHTASRMRCTLKGSYMMLLKRMLFCAFGVMQYVYVARGSKNTLFSTLLLLLCAPPFWNASMFTKLIVLRSQVCSDWPAIRCVVIGRIPQACNGNVTPLTMLYVMLCPSATRLKQ